MEEIYEVRDAIHGFVKLNQWERDIINHPAFQRLRRIKQLAWTDMVYPGASHSRFEHSLGVMHVVSSLFDSIRNRQSHFLKDTLKYNDAGLGRVRALLRIAALLHDVGHPPFSHAAEDIFPINPQTEDPYPHEDYSVGIIRNEFAGVIQNHKANERNYHLTVEEVVSFISGAPSKDSLIWGNLLSSQMDGDRMDYLLRDAYHAGVNYGKFDLNRLLATVRLVEKDEEGYTIGVDEDGIHAAEGLILARYMMFTQLYFHKTRAIYDYHLVEAMKEILKPNNGTFPPPDTDKNIEEFLRWDDWRVFGAIANGEGGAHGQMLLNRKHYRRLRETKEVPEIKDLEWAEALLAELAPLGAVRRDAGKSWYKFQQDEILVKKDGYEAVSPLSYYSPVVSGLKTVKQVRLYVPENERANAELIVKKFEGGGTV